jgi:hypothetical protein
VNWLDRVGKQLNVSIIEHALGAEARRSITHRHQGSSAANGDDAGKIIRPLIPLLDVLGKSGGRTDLDRHTAVGTARTTKLPDFGRPGIQALA